MDHNLNTSKGFPSQLQHNNKKGVFTTDFLTSPEPASVGQTYTIGLSKFVINEVEHRLSQLDYGISHPVVWNRVKSTPIN